MKNKLIVIIIVSILFSINIAAAEKSRSSFISLEVFGGVGIIDPEDFNLIGQADADLEWYFFEKRYKNYESYGGNISINSGEYPQFNKQLPVGIRLVFHLSDLINIWGGVRHAGVYANDNISYRYTGSDLNTIGSDSRDYSPYIVSASTWTFQAGIKLVFINKNKFKAGLVGGIGIVTASCHYETLWEDFHSFIWTKDDDPEVKMEFKRNGSYEMEGNGSALCYETGLFINWQLGKKLGVFIESVYNAQKISNISGRGSEIIDGVETTWEGKWRKITEKLYSYNLGTLFLRYIDNREIPAELIQIRNDFVLDLSGFEFRIGVKLSF
ncbi:MAG: hypothetical protein KAR14_11000 [Candidatus Aminicenantes bacterium]|nr:hypothetical protein [Candidatus Aminicenantes bacterium]